MMDYRKTNAPTTTVTRDMIKLCHGNEDNVYETVMVIAKRSNQIAAEMKQDLEKKLQEFASFNDNLEEVFENREQIEISRYYEKLPKPTLFLIRDLLDSTLDVTLLCRPRRFGKSPAMRMLQCFFEPANQGVTHRLKI